MTRIFRQTSRRCSWDTRLPTCTAMVGPESKTVNCYAVLTAFCEVFVTLDRNLEFQQNTKILPFGIVVVRARSNRIVDLKPYIPDILSAAGQVAPGRVVSVGVE